MTEYERNDTVVEQLRSMAIAGESVSALLRCVQRLMKRTDCQLASVQSFHEAFGAGIASISPIAGWCGFGGELSDSQVETFVGSVLRDYRESVANELASLR